MRIHGKIKKEMVKAIRTETKRLDTALETEAVESTMLHPSSSHMHV